MRYDRIFTKLFRTPLLLEPNARAGFEASFFAHLTGEEFRSPQAAREAEVRFESRVQDPKSSEKRTAWIYEGGKGSDGRTAIIHIDGVLDRHLSMMEVSCFNATDVNDLLRAIAQAKRDPGTSNVLLYFNSPGGSVAGIPEAADAIAALSDEKNVFAYTDGLCCSAAYWLAAACDQVFASPSASVGSIGVYLALLDESRRLENFGVKVEMIKDGRLKGAGASWKPLTEDERSHFQAQVLQLGEMFRSGVRAKRPSVDDDVMQGQAFFGAAAMEAGLVDAILPSMEAALEQF